ncbi:MAG: HD domain-containing protein [Rubrobacteraceae bacterium]|nr:HD domain-containing protein [Rubrobacteraceae bacterium]
MGQDHLRTCLSTLTAFAVTLVASWVYWYGVPSGGRFFGGAILFAGLAAVLRFLPGETGARTGIGPQDVVLVCALALLGPIWTSAAALPAAFFTASRDGWRASCEAASTVIAACLAGMAFIPFYEPLLLGTPRPAPAIFYGTFLAGVVLIASRDAAGLLLLRVREGHPVVASWRESVQPYLPAHAAAVLTASLAMVAFAAYEPAAAGVALVGAALSRILASRARSQTERLRALQGRVRTLEETLSKANLWFAATMILELGRRDGYAHRHAAATAVYARDLALELGLNEARAAQVRLAALLHDIGMSGFESELLLDAPRFEPTPRGELAEHTSRGAELLSPVPGFEEMASWVLWHHERPDGRGYPDGLRGPWIPLEAKIIAAAQAYAALVLQNPHRKGLPPEEARSRLVAGAGEEFDASVVRALLRILDTEPEGYGDASAPRFAFPEPPRPGSLRRGA